MKRIESYQSFLENILLIKNKQFLDQQERERQEKNKDKVTRGTVGFVSTDKNKQQKEKSIDDYEVETEGEMEETQGQAEMEETQGQDEMQGQSEDEACDECD